MTMLKITMLHSVVRRFWHLAVFGFILCSLYLFFLIVLVNDQQQLARLGFLRRRTTDPVPVRIEQSVGDFSWIKRRLRTNPTELANWLFADEDTPPPKKISYNRTTPFLILVWEHGPFLERRHLRRFSADRIFSPWTECSVNNCILTYKPEHLHVADAVIFHLHLTKGVNSMPKRKNRNQRWIFMTDESPMNTFLYSSQKMSDYDGIFNWSMTYRMNSDVPVPYGRTVVASLNRIHQSTPPTPTKRKKLVGLLASNCGGHNNRWKYVKQLKKYLGDDMTILGHCFSDNTTACPGHFNNDCPAFNEFMFYLAFENSNCREYLSEKVFWNAYEKEAVPVIMGAPRFDCERLLPPNSYLHVENFANPSALANYLLYLKRNPQEYEELHAWRSTYRIINEHGYFGIASKHYCRVCQALNYNSRDEKVYTELNNFWNKERDCSRPK